MKNYEALADLRVKTALHIEKAFDRGYEQGYEDGTKAKDGERGTVYHDDYGDYGDGLKNAYEKGLRHGQELRAEEVKCAEACGMKRAWEAARKILHMEQRDINKMMGGSDFGDINIIDELTPQEVISMLEAWEKKQERYCYNCGQPRDYKNSCIPYKEGKCDKSHKAWTPKQDAPKMNVGSIEVGDEVKYKSSDDYGIVTKKVLFNADLVYIILWKDGRMGRIYKSDLIKTGRHFTSDLSNLLSMVQGGD